MDLNQVTLPVSNFDDAVAFYETLGLNLIVSSRGEYARFECPNGSGTLSLHLTNKPVVPGIVIYFECTDLDERVATLKSAGVKFTTDPADRPWLWREARLADPSGNQLCLFSAGENRRNPPWRID